MILNTKIALSLASIATAGALVGGATFALFSDSETSHNNTFTAGSLDLKVDSQSHYAGLVCNADHIWQQDGNATITRPDLTGLSCDGTWSQTDLTSANKFFNLTDIKPGDKGEDTISLHVVDNDAWGWFSIKPTANDDVTCTSSELVADPSCTNPGVGTGELQGALNFNVWLDQGAIPGFQGHQNDPTEGDNIHQNTEPSLTQAPGPIDPTGETYNLWQILAAYRTQLGATCNADNGDGVTPNATGICQGLAQDGRLVKSTNYYFGVGWELPASTGNAVQTDKFVADMSFHVDQQRNNPSPSPLPLNPGVVF